MQLQTPKISSMSFLKCCLLQAMKSVEKSRFLKTDVFHWAWVLGCNWQEKRTKCQQRWKLRRVEGMRNRLLWPSVSCRTRAATANELIDVTKWHYAISLPSNLFFPPMELLSQLWGRTFISSPLQMDHILKFNCFVTLAVWTLCIKKNQLQCQPLIDYRVFADIMFRIFNFFYPPSSDPKREQKLFSLYCNQRLKTKLDFSVFSHRFCPNLHSFVTTDFLLLRMVGWQWSFNLWHFAASDFHRNPHSVGLLDLWWSNRFTLVSPHCDTQRHFSSRHHSLTPVVQAKNQPKILKLRVSSNSLWGGPSWILPFFTMRWHTLEEPFPRAWLTGVPAHILRETVAMLLSHMIFSSLGGWYVSECVWEGPMNPVLIYFFSNTIIPDRSCGKVLTLKP